MKNLMLTLVILLSFSFQTVQAKQHSPNWVANTWCGRGYEIFNRVSWSIQLQYHAKNNNYEINYPSLGCKGYWKLHSINEQEAVFTEYITAGKGTCSDAGRVVIRFINAHQAEFLYWYSFDLETVVASALLLRCEG